MMMEVNQKGMGSEEEAKRRERSAVSEDSLGSGKLYKGDGWHSGVCRGGLQWSVYFCLLYLSRAC